jgi:peptide/nickel transport system substrate-binding protein
MAAELASEPGSRLLRYPTTTLTAVILDLRPTHPEFRDAEARQGLLRGIDRAALIESVFAGLANRASTPIPPTSRWHDAAAAAQAPADFDRRAALAALRGAGWTRVDDRWRLPRTRTPYAVELISPDKASDPTVFAAAAAVARDWTRLGVGVEHVPLAPAVFAGERLARGEFAAAVVDITIGPDPDLYPLLASSQTLTGGSNIAGLQDALLDPLLVAARAPGTDEMRRAAYGALQAQLAKGTYILPIAFADAPVVVRDAVSGQVVRDVADPADRFWDVLTWRLADDR